MGEAEPPAGARGGPAPKANTLARDVPGSDTPGSDTPDRDTPGSDATPNALSPARYLGWLYSTDAQKPVLAALLEIEAEIASGLRPGMEHHVAHARLQWWSEEAERVAQGRPVHPMAKELVKAHVSGASQAGEASARSIAAAAAALATASAEPPTTTNPSGITPRADIAGFVDTAVWDLARATFETRQELTAYCERWATAMFETSAVARGSTAPGEVPPAASAWKTLGAVVREIELLADAARDANAGRVRMPLDELDRVGVDPNALVKLPWPAPLAAHLKERHQALRATIAANVATLGREEQMGLRGLLVWVTLTWWLSVRAEHALPNVILPRRYDSLAAGWQAWRAARRAATGKLRLD